MKKSILNILLLLISIIVSFTLSLKMNNYERFDYALPNSLIPIFLLISTFILCKKSLTNKNVRLKQTSFIVSLIFAIMIVIGNCLYCNLELISIITNGIVLIKSVLYFISTLTISYVLILNIYTGLDKIKFTKWNIPDSIYTYLIIWLLIIFAWIPYFLSCYPGILTPDPILQIEQIIGLQEITNNYPIIHTLLIKFCLNVASLFGNYTTGIGLYSIIQMIIMSFIFTITIRWMVKNNFNSRLILFALGFYALYPVNAFYSVTVWKDIIYSVLILLFFILVYSIIQKEDQFKNYIIFFIVIVGCTLFRNNGFLVIIPVLLILIFKLKNNRKPLSISLICLVSFLLLWISSLNFIFKIPTTSTIDAFSVPLQQVARIYVKNGDTLTKHEIKLIDKYFNTNIKDYYNPQVSDAVKDNFKLDEYKNDKLSFITLWIKLVFKHPIISLESFLYNNYGYWYPKSQHWVVARGIIDSEKNWQIQNGPHEKPLINGSFVDIIQNFIDNRKIPIIPMLYSLGFLTWIILIMMAYTIYKKERKTFLSYTPIIFVFINCIFSPVWAEFRYYYPIIVCLPVIMAIATKNHKT